MRCIYQGVYTELMNETLTTGTNVTIVEGTRRIRTAVKSVNKNGRQIVVEATEAGYTYQGAERIEIQRFRIFTVRKNGAFVESDGAFSAKGGNAYLEF